MSSDCQKCLKKNFQLIFGHTDRKHITITDSSDWMNNDKPEKYTIKITNTTHNLSNEISILATGTNVLSTIELFGTKEKLCLQDGFYCIECISCGRGYKINRVFVANTECMIDHLFIKAVTKEDLDMVNDFYQDLKMVIINADLGRMETAKKVFMTLTKKLNTIGCNECGC